MGRKLKGKLGGGKGLRGALARQAMLEKTKPKMETSLTNKLKPKVNHKQQQSTTPKKGLIPFDTDSTLLLVGEGDFSFARSIVAEGLISPENLVATSYDSLEELKSKYPQVEENLEVLENDNVKVLYNIDATKLVETLNLARKSSPMKLFTGNKHLTSIMFNFPHTGRGMKDVDRNIRDHQKLMLDFFRSSKQVFRLINNQTKNDFGGYDASQSNNSKIIFTLFEGEPYNSWGVKMIARSEGYKVERSGVFDWSLFPGYHHRRTNGVRDTTKPAAERNARIYILEKFVAPKKQKKSKTDSDSDSDD
ncbi:uncharacterized protein KQ657_000819 [Scheffersomyces spartinae]|uniref:25S rRNA (uridine-N(3))-methyltransferase BMT5-like domain-containing protein n=1 Tax=Scheffersomyces spartinae TaxID=45513 RepID=A0A9P7V8T9_9ASCO|nr:uncharacterized protein KQ657_000819 [Scheffersomyces spartinae]KAG7193401.1 hypothetical protein KQ657_000819 [Scheffersomyces spartinae]